MTSEIKIISRDEAKAQGLKRYFTGKPCKYGHVAERYATSIVCVECERTQYEANPEKTNARARAWREANPEKVRARARARAKEIKIAMHIKRLQESLIEGSIGEIKIISRAEAIAQGLNRYFTGKPCKYGHVVERYATSKGCVECARGYYRTQYEANPEKVHASSRAWKEANPEKVRAKKTKRYKERRLAIKIKRLQESMIQNHITKTENYDES